RTTTNPRPGSSTTSTGSSQRAACLTATAVNSTPPTAACKPPDGRPRPPGAAPRWTVSPRRSTGGGESVPARSIRSCVLTIFGPRTRPPGTGHAILDPMPTQALDRIITDAVGLARHIRDGAELDAHLHAIYDPAVVIDEDGHTLAADAATATSAALLRLLQYHGPITETAFDHLVAEA